MKFEDHLQKLQKNISELESPSVSLSEGIALFEEGVKHIKDCLSVLEESKGKISIIRQELDSVLESPFIKPEQNNGL